MKTDSRFELETLSYEVIPNKTLDKTSEQVETKVVRQEEEKEPSGQ